jgi:hypothetical protein
MTEAADSLAVSAASSLVPRSTPMLEELCMSLSLTLAAITGYDNDALTEDIAPPLDDYRKQPPEQQDAAGCDWPADHELNEVERWRLRQFLTPRTGHGHRVVWPVDELLGQAP